MRIAFVLALLFVALIPARSWADCVSRSACVCGYNPRAAIEGEVLSTSDGSSTLRVKAIDGDTSVVVVGDTVVAVGRDTQVGDHWLAAQAASNDQWYLLSKAVRGQVDCAYAPTLSLSSADALSLAVATNCEALFEAKAKEQGLPAEECKDVVTGVSLFGCHCSSASAASMLALLPLLLRRRRKQ